MTWLAIALVLSAIFCASEYFSRLEIRRAKERDGLSFYSFDPWAGVFSRDKTASPETAWAVELFRIINSIMLRN